ncbi:MAG: hypothetical protein GXX89_11120 [Clostridiales bacterium]|jgi:hypothetical protein|nr:hypothetical protein [Clostridiales bacterium]
MKHHWNLVRPLIWRDGPEGLYPTKLFWMDGKNDMEGFNACFSYQFIKEPCTFHPIEGMVVHPYDEVLVFASRNLDDITDLGAVVSIEIGKERELYTFDKSQSVCIPKGVPHGPVKVHSVSMPFVHYTISLAPEYSGKMIPASELPEPVPGSRKYDACVRIFAWGVDPKTGKPLHSGGANIHSQDRSGMGYTNLVDEKGVMHPQLAVGPKGMGPGNADNLVWLYGDELMGFQLNYLWGHYTKCGKWHREGESHTHPEEEILVLVGLDPDDPMNIGAEIEIAMGDDDERYVCNTPTVYICPKGFPHLPMITRWVDRPYGFIVANLDGTHDSPWGKSKDEEHVETK